YSPTVNAPGSSVSHYTTEASPNQLMEPSINADLSHEIAPPRDLTLPLLLDIGW
ncbi:peptidase, partial [Acinetobacter baumannii]|nr:peptidase [Acinetobacter baumannii]